jgi:NADH dehydrogenase FAD-containing subunit
MLNLANVQLQTIAMCCMMCTQYTINNNRLVTDDWCRIKGFDSIYALGDCGVIDKRPLPQTAQVSIALYYTTVTVTRLT